MEKTFQYKDTAVAYNTAGEGVPVVLLHGFGEDAEVWHRQVDFLKPHCRLILPYLPGTRPSGFADAIAGTEDFADCIYALLQQEHIETCILLGHSMGGYITLAFAEKYPGLLKGFGLIHSTAFADSEEKKQTRIKGIAMMEEYGGYAFLKSTTPNLFAAKFKEDHPEEIDGLMEKGRSFTVPALQQYYRVMMERPDRTNVLADSGVPVLFVIGTEDVAAPMKDVLQQTHLPKTAYIHILEGTGHMGMWEDEATMNNALLEFITATK